MTLAVFVLGALAAAAQEWTEHAAPSSGARGRILISTWLNGSGPYPFLLDACLQSPVISPGLAQTLGLPLHGQSANVVDVESLVVADLPAHPVEMPVADLTALSARLGTPLAGLMPAQQPGLELTIDLEHARAAWRPLEQSTLPKAARTIPLKIAAGGAPTVSVLLNGKHLRHLALDIACPDAIALPETELRAIGAWDGGAPLMVMHTADGQALRYLRLAQFRVDDAGMDDPVCAVLPPGSMGRLGIGFLTLFRVTMNFEHGLMGLERSDARVFRDAPVTGTGVGLGYYHEGLWRLDVMEGSPAHQGGLRPGDCLLAVNGVPAVEMSRRPDAGYALIAPLLSPGEGERVFIAAGRPNPASPGGMDEFQLPLQSIRLL